MNIELNDKLLKTIDQFKKFIDDVQNRKSIYTICFINGIDMNPYLIGTVYQKNNFNYFSGICPSQMLFSIALLNNCNHDEWLEIEKIGNAKNYWIKKVTISDLHRLNNNCNIFYI